MQIVMGNRANKIKRDTEGLRNGNKIVDQDEQRQLERKGKKEYF